MPKNTEKQLAIAEHQAEIMKLLGLDLKDPSLKETPYRVAKMLVNDLFWGLDESKFPDVKVFPNDSGYDQMLVQKDIVVHSTCVPGYQTVNAVDGSKRAREVVVGDRLWTLSNGIPAKTTVGKITKTKNRSIVEVQLENGTIVEVTHDHPIMTKSGWKEASELVVGVDEVEYIKAHSLCKQEYSFNVGWDLGYFIGAIAADGSIQDDRRICLEVNDEWFAKKVQTAGKKAFGIEKEIEPIKKPSGFKKEIIDQYRYRIVSSQIAKRIQKLLQLPEGNGSKSKTKKFHLPQLVRTHTEFRKGFLEGYIDGDGTRYKNENWSDRIVSSNAKFVLEITDFLGVDYSTRSEGGVHDFHVHKRWYEKHGFDKDEYSLDLGESTFVKVVSLTAKKESTVYSFKCEEHPTFLVQGILTHNCEHHFVPFIGVAHVAYIPKENIIGLSKIVRLVNYFAHRPQVQERLTQQIAQTLGEVLKTESIAVVLECKHLCYTIRGVKDHGTHTTTAYVGGAFKKETTRQEFFNHINKARNGHV